MEKSTIIVYGAGLMGSGIAACAATHGHPVILIDMNQELADIGKKRAINNILQLAEQSLIDNVSCERAKLLVQADTDYRPYLQKTEIIIEAVSENLEIKNKVFRELDSNVPKNIIITSNTSGMMLKNITQGIAHPERTAITHFWFPGHLIPLVEIVMGEFTSDDVADKLKTMLLRWGKAPVIVRQDLPGQLANRILQAIIRESINIVEMGLATAEDVDTAIKMGMALRFPAWGPLEHIDAVGLDLALSVQRDVLPEISSQTVPAKYLSKLVAEGNLGTKTGAGIYDWTKKDIFELSNQRDACIIQNIKLLKSFTTSQ